MVWKILIRKSIVSIMILPTYPFICVNYAVQKFAGYS